MKLSKQVQEMEENRSHQIYVYGTMVEVICALWIVDYLYSISCNGSAGSCLRMYSHCLTSVLQFWIYSLQTMEDF
jgi:hypothetical protein